MLSPTLAPGILPHAQRIYAVGDVHGCAEQLSAMHRLIAADLASRPVAEPQIVHLGDYIDRGQDSAGVIEILLQPWPSAGPAPHRVHLMGNHEEMMLAAVAAGDRATVQHWLDNGGAETLQSWNVPRRAKPRDWAMQIPPQHHGFLRGLSLVHQAGGYLFVHAGLRPGVPLERQSRHDMLWIREPFLSWLGPLPAVVVHGHTPESEVVVRPNRIGIDTGAAMGGFLSCVVLEADRMALLRT
jgi:serine/threonine protein phosphatase 1